MEELAPPPDPVVRRADLLEAIRRRAEQISIMEAELRLAVAELVRNGAPQFQRYTHDELALVWHRSPRQARNRMDQAMVFAGFPAVHSRIADGTWLIDHADAVLDELVLTELTHPEQQQVLELVLSRRGRKTPWELRAAVRAACLVLFPDAAARRAEKARVDRDVRSYQDAPGCASLLASGPASAIAAMMASLEALTWPPAPSDTRTAAQRRFDALYDLVCGRTTPTQWQVQVLVGLGTLEGRDELPAELPGFGPVPAPQAREVCTRATLRRVVVDGHGQLVAVDARLHRPDQPPTAGPAVGTPTVAAPPYQADAPTDEFEPDPDAPSLADQLWYDEQLDRARTDAAQAGAADDATASPATGDPTTRSDRRAAAMARLAAVEPEAAPAPAPETTHDHPLGSLWSETAFLGALHQLRTGPVRPHDLRSDQYAVPTRLRRHLVLRDRTCVFPGCPRRADQCDKDHLVPWPRGTTSESNLASECEHHHHAKHDYFTVTRLPDGTIRWTLPTGTSHDRPPRPVLEAATYAGGVKQP